MLLGLMRKHAKSWLIKAMIAIIAIVFVFYFGYSFREKAGGKVAYVNGELITGDEYRKAYFARLDVLKRQYQSMWNDKLLKALDLENTVLEELIEKRLIGLEAERIGLGITDQEIQDTILSYPAFQNNGRFDQNRYHALLGNNRMTPMDFEEAIKHDLLQAKVMHFLSTFMPVSNHEALDNYSFSNEQVKISYVQFAPKDYKKSVKVDDTEMGTYFEENKENYRIPEKIKISHITIDPAAFKDDVKLEDQRIEYYYEDNLEKFKVEKEIKARHILFRVSPEASEEEENKIKEKALSVLEEARKNKDFAALAKKYSEGPTAEKGGDLGYFSRGRMVEPFEDVAFGMEKGEISDLVRTEFGFHIIKVEEIKEARTKPFEEVKKQIERTLLNHESGVLAYNRAIDLLDHLPYDVDLARYAEENNVPMRVTGFFSQDQPVPGIGGDVKFRESLFALDKGDVSQMVELNNKYYIIQVVDKQASYLPEIEEVSANVKNDFINHLSAIAAKTAAEKYLEQLRQGKDWETLAKENKLKPQVTDFFTRQRLPPIIGYAPELLETVFTLNEDNRYPEQVFENTKGTFVVRWEEKKGIEPDKYKEEEADYRNATLMVKTQAVYRDWIERIKEGADIDRSPFEQFR